MRVVNEITTLSWHALLKPIAHTLLCESKNMLHYSTEHVAVTCDKSQGPTQEGLNACLEE